MPTSTPDGNDVAVTPLCACGTTERHVSNPDMCRNGHFVRDNTARRTHGVRAFETTGRVPDLLRQTVEQFRESVIADRGGVSELSTLELGYIQHLSNMETVARLLASDLASRGLMTAKGRVRGTLLKWLEVVGTWDRLAQRIGTDRRPRGVASLSAYLTSASAHEEQ
jgi:hypothetical protein